ncbi:MAG: hypothetical protein HZA52_18170 [Planctomycetes bacterium]|nr:hypothetical protein [Planctomycetota bacterium]
MGSFLRAFYILMFAVPAILLLAGVPSSSTREEVETEVLSLESTLVDRLWSVPKYGVKLRVPPSWAWMANGKREGVCLDPNQRERAAMSVIALPNFFGRNLFQLEAENVDALRGVPGIELDSSRRVSVEGVEILRFDYRGRQVGLDVDMRYICLVWLAHGQQVILTVQLEASRWAELSPGVEDALASLSLRD